MENVQANEDTALVKQEAQTGAVACKEDINLTDQETLFCELLMNGGTGYAGNVVKCYQEAFGVRDAQSVLAANQLMQQKDIQAYLAFIDMPIVNEGRIIKRFLTVNLMNIVQEMSTAEYTNRYGNPMPAGGSRSVAVHASKVLMDLYGLRNGSESMRTTEGSDEEAEEKDDRKIGLTFNVVVPSAEPKVEDHPTIIVNDDEDR